MVVLSAKETRADFVTKEAERGDTGAGDSFAERPIVLVGDSGLVDSCLLIGKLLG